MEIRKSRLKSFLKINKNLQSSVNKVANLLHLTESKSPGSSLRSRSHKYKKLRYENNNLEVVNIGLFGHDIMRNQEYKLLERNLDYFKEPILDVGCGDGQFATLLFDKVDAGIDLSSHSIASASNLDIYADLKVADCTKKIPYDDETFNTIFSNSVLEHIPNIEGVVKESSRTLKRGGNFIITTYSNVFLEKLRLEIGEEMANSYNSGLTHVSLYDLEHWNVLLKKYGLKKVKLVPYLSIDALLQMVIYSSRFYVIPQLLFPSLFWYLSKEKLNHIVSKSLDTDEGLGFLLIAQKS